MKAKCFSYQFVMGMLQIFDYKSKQVYTKDTLKVPNLTGKEKRANNMKTL